MVTTGACELFGPGDFGEIVEIVPISSGNKWIYVHSYLDTLGNTFDRETTYMEVRHDTVLSGTRWAYSFFHGNGLALRNTESGLHVRLPNLGSPDQIMTMYSFPPIRGSTYGWPTTMYGGGPPRLDGTWFSCTVESPDTVITIPLGVFRCIVYKVSPDPYRENSYHFVSPGTGLIKIERYYRNVRSGIVYRRNSTVLDSLILNP